MNFYSRFVDNDLLIIIIYIKIFTCSNINRWLVSLFEKLLSMEIIYMKCSERVFANTACYKFSYEARKKSFSTIL